MAPNNTYKREENKESQLENKIPFPAKNHSHCIPKIPNFIVNLKFSMKKCLLKQRTIKSRKNTAFFKCKKCDFYKTIDIQCVLDSYGFPFFQTGNAVGMQMGMRKRYVYQYIIYRIPKIPIFLYNFYI